MTKSAAEAEKANLEKPQSEGAQATIDSHLARLSLVALGPELKVGRPSDKD